MAAEDVIEQTQVVMTRIHNILAVGLLLIWIGGPVYSQPASQIQEVIKTYNRILQEEARSERHRSITTFIKMMEDIADKKVAQKLYIWIQSWHENGLFMHADLKDIKFTKTDIKGDTAIAETREVWVYRYIDRRINRVVLPDTRIIYTVRYTLYKKDGNWIIKEIKVLSEKKEKINNQEGKR